MQKNKEKQKIVVICGPTASGKSAIALDLCLRLNGVIISADSRQVYEGMDIGTGKEVDKNEYDIVKENGKWKINGVNVYGYDLVKPDEDFSVALYEKAVMERFLPQIQEEEKLPILVGGTGFYLKAITDGIETISVPRNLPLRKSLEEEYETKGTDFLYMMLSELDSQRACNIDKHNHRRIIRAIEVAIFKQKEIVETLQPRNFSILWIGINWDRKVLFQRIDQRSKKMLDFGLIAEISHLLHTGYSWGLPSFQAIGYQEFRSFFEERSSIKSCLERFQWNSHAYARRQMTWFNKEKRITWISAAEGNYLSNIENQICRFLKD